MSTAKKRETWNGMTQSHGFIVDVFEDEEQGLYIANIDAYSPPLVPALLLRAKPDSMSFEDQEKLRDPDLEMLKALTKAHLTKRYGKILQFLERLA